MSILNSFDSLFDINDSMNSSSNILFTEEDMNSILNVQGNRKLYEEEVKEVVRNCNTDDVDVTDWFRD